MGAMIAEKETSIIEKGTIWKTLLLSAIFALLLAVEEVVLGILNWNIKGVDTVVMLVPFSWFFFTFLLKWEIQGSDKLFLMLRKYSLLLFLCQRIPLLKFSSMLYCTPPYLLINSFICMESEPRNV